MFFMMWLMLEDLAPILSFGKYRGEAVDEVPASYQMWLYEQAFVHEDYPELGEWLKENLDEIEEKFIEEEQQHDDEDDWHSRDRDDEPWGKD